MRKQSTGRREQARIFQFGEQWLGQEQEGGPFYRYWYDTRSGRVGRKSLGTRSLEEAKVALVRIVLSEPGSDPCAPEAVAIASVFKFYEINHACKTRSARVSIRAMQLCIDFLKKVTDLPAPAVSTFGLARQHAFMLYCKEIGCGTKTISTYLGQIQAALNYAATPRMILDSKGVEREGQMLKANWKIRGAIDYVSKITGLPMPVPRSYIPADEQVAALIDELKTEYMFRYVIMALNTWARPEAILELDVSKQVDFANGLVDLNQKGRRQNNKVRPLIRLTDNLKGWLLYWNDSRPLRGARGKIMNRIHGQNFELPCKRAGVPLITPYTLRHYMATRSRRVPENIKPAREERSAWMGHIDPHHRTTEKFYESFDPYYLANVAKAIDAIMLTLDNLGSKSLFSPNSLPSHGLVVVENPNKISDKDKKSGLV